LLEVILGESIGQVSYIYIHVLF